ncbi:hypothetical protein [Salinimicrobium oceani]|uniref:Uncharacterized protein n=1 Tax=Salinimicrobium oceani TaxID=2722702 RepID=A0ABX1D1L9_9FLAO|nr:hypothetical protein [Salinimicrobium oceani]NJW53053.1 hypothetical protein [Salinimicrobium oceani]
MSSINKYYGELSGFVREANLYGVTNGKIHLMAEMMEPPYNLYNLTDQYLIPLGLEEKRDFVLVTEQLLPGRKQKSKPARPIPELENVPWLDGIITEDGYYVWYQEKNTSENSKDIVRRKIL